MFSMRQCTVQYTLRSRSCNSQKNFCIYTYNLLEEKWILFLSSDRNVFMAFQVDGVSYLLQEIYGIENKYNTQESKVSHSFIKWTKLWDIIWSEHCQTDHLRGFRYIVSNKYLLICCSAFELYFYMLIDYSSLFCITWISRCLSTSFNVKCWLWPIRWPMMRSATTVRSVWCVFPTCATHSSFPADTCVCATPAQTLCATKPTAAQSAVCVRTCLLHGQYVQFRNRQRLFVLY